MVASTGKTGRGVFIQVSDGASPPVWSTIGNVTSIGPKGLSAAEIDFTHLLSEGGFREYRQGFKDAGTVDVELHLNPSDTGHQGLLSDFVDGTVLDWRIDFSDAGGVADGGFAYYLEFSGFVQNAGDVTINIDNPIASTVTIRRTGASTWTAIT